MRWILLIPLCVIIPAAASAGDYPCGKAASFIEQFRGGTGSAYANQNDFDLALFLHYSTHAIQTGEQDGSELIHEARAAFPEFSGTSDGDMVSEMKRRFLGVVRCIRKGSFPTTPSSPPPSG